ncbi:hypothetical protein NBH00_05175 [Paraconexibacter antarcticus]|uniref:Uncharacterized protein n=1 Tax=Paraconexibacter antarcticus TaxID=2949664 RepID=A0ABY5DXQ4_9ACTN|nr:hypothetical protein [Paraconexibacter antarcticus]UTI65602.1 hypothetical protein NBH00_05175 [Paraconexibacter antarcticus]
MKLPFTTVQDPGATLNFEAISKLLLTGRGSPAGVVSASPPQLYLNLSGGASTTLYVKETGVNTTSGWRAV